MIDITKDEFWENKYEEITKENKKTNLFKEFITNHKIISILLMTLSILITINTILIFKFFEIIEVI